MTLPVREAMSEPSDRPPLMKHRTTVTTAETIRADTVKPVIREGIIIVGMFLFVFLGSTLPGTGREIPGTAVSIGDLVVTFGALGIVGSIIYAGPKLRELVITNLDGPEAVVSDAASIVRNAALVVAIMAAHVGFAPVLVPLLGVGWWYDVAFLLLVLVPIGVIAYRLYRSLDPLAAFLTEVILGRSGVRDPQSTAADEESS